MILSLALSLSLSLSLSFIMPTTECILLRTTWERRGDGLKEGWRSGYVESKRQ